MENEDGVLKPYLSLINQKVDLVLSSDQLIVSFAPLPPRPSAMATRNEVKAGVEGLFSSVPILPTLVAGQSHVLRHSHPTITWLIANIMQYLISID